MDDSLAKSFKFCVVPVVALAWVMQLGVIWSFDRAPLVDWPNHMARHVLEARWLAGEELPPYYKIEYRVLPNQGSDLVVPFFLQVFSIPVSSNLFLSLSVLLYWIGPTVYLLAVHGNRPAVWGLSLLLLPLTMNRFFLWGFLNYYSGVGLAFLTLAHFLFLMRRDGLSLFHLLLHIALVGLLFIWHLAAWGLYGIIMGSHLLAWMIDARRGGRTWSDVLGRAAILILPSLCSFALVWLYWTGQVRTTDARFRLGSNDWMHKIRDPFSLFVDYAGRWDAVMAGLWALAFAVWFFGRGISINKGPLLATVLLVAAYIVTPFNVGTTSAADFRILPGVLVCGLACLGEIPIRRWCWGLGLVIACIAVRHVNLYMNWQRLNDRGLSHAQAFDFFKKGDRVLPVPLPLDYGNVSLPEMHYLCWAIPDKELFVPTIFASRDQHVLQLTRDKTLPYDAKNGVFRLQEESVRERFDWLWVIDLKKAAPQLALPDEKLDLSDNFECVFRDNETALYRVRRGLSLNWRMEIPD